MFHAPVMQINNYLRFGCTPIAVLDGAAPEEKLQTLQSRHATGAADPAVCEWVDCRSCSSSASRDADAAGVRAGSSPGTTSLGAERAVRISCACVTGPPACSRQW